MMKYDGGRFREMDLSIKNLKLHKKSVVDDFNFRKQKKKLQVHLKVNKRYPRMENKQMSLEIKMKSIIEFQLNPID